MSAAYEEIVNGESLLRSPPDVRHERICAGLHVRVGAAVASLSSTRLLPLRSVVRVAAGTIMRPDLSLVASATGKLWLAAEVINAHDHQADTVMKKTIYEETSLPRLWVIDPRYDNVEIYHGSPYGLVLKKILTNTEVLEEPLLPGFAVTVGELFQA
ncbi:MAG: Uma2 family endonuclease [Verrucomicrobiota bacterium]